MQNHQTDGTGTVRRTIDIERAWFKDVMAAWETARSAYAALLREGVDRADEVLARDPAYALLLRTGLELRRLGGEAAVTAAVANLAIYFGRDAECHMDRLWYGLVDDYEERAYRTRLQ